MWSGLEIDEQACDRTARTWQDLGSRGGRSGSLPQVAGGFTTSESREHWVRQGFRVTTLDGSSAVLVHVDFSGRVRVGKYGIRLVG